MSVFHLRDDQANFYDFRNQTLANDFFFGEYGRAASAVSPSAAILSPGPHALIDNVPGNTSTTATLTVDALRIVSAVDTIADEDFYSITLIAGHQYQIGMYGYSPQGVGDPVGPNGAPLLDSYLELYDAAGNLITSADGGSDTALNSANSGFDALMTFTATATGTYYVNARAFDNVPADGDNGDMVGDYGLYAKDVTGDESLYTPYYSPNSPLYAIDWGTQVNKVHQTYRNPDGNEGTHPTGTPQSPVDPGAAIGQPGKNVISIYFAQAGDIFVSNDLTNPGLPPATITATGVQPFEHTAVMTALAEFSKVADVVYVEVSDRAQADFIYTSYQGTPGPGVSLLGSMSPPDESDEGLAQFNSGDERWNARDLAQGGFSFVTLIHEFGHGHGLAHPHDNGGHSGIMNGVEPEGAGVADYTTGDFELNQGVFTMMSYEDGWQSSPYGNAPTNVGYGYLGGLMAFDIAAIQDKYGVNEEWATGNDTYVLKDVNAPGTYYTSIWDGGGTDIITYSGSRDTYIDLRSATLQYEVGGGGRVSYAYGIYGGFTIANGVTIENATGGSGNDTLIGNDADNVLNGYQGRDHAAGGLGNDWYFVDSAGDTIAEGATEGAIDRVFASADYTLYDGVYVEILSTDWHAGTAAINLGGNELNNVIYGNAGANILYGKGGADWLEGFGGDDFYYVDSAGDMVVEGASGGNDRVFASADYTLYAGQAVEILSTDWNAGTAAIALGGNELANTIYGNDGNNILYGKGGADTFYGRGGADTFLFITLGAGDIDTILDFASGTDKIALYQTAFTAMSAGSLNASAFVTGTAAGDADDRIIYNSATGALFYDADGSGAGAAMQFASVTPGMTLSASDFVVW
jgi:serralysin